MLDLGRQWAAQVANGRAFLTAALRDDDEMRALAAEGERIFAAEQVLLNAIMATPANTIAGLALKAQVLARTHDVQDRGIAAVEAAAEGETDLVARASFSLVLDVMKLARGIT